VEQGRRRRTQAQPHKKKNTTNMPKEKWGAIALTISGMLIIIILVLIVIVRILSYKFYITIPTIYYLV